MAFRKMDGLPRACNPGAWNVIGRLVCYGAETTLRERKMSHYQFVTCLRACDDTAAHCDFCASACLQDADPKPMDRCIALCIDAAAVCRLASAAMARDSESLRAVCGLCAQICETCANECARHPPEHCQLCAQSCMRCAQECRAVANY
jgi:hypothetical protein